MPSILIVDFGTRRQAVELAAAATAIQRGLEEDFFPAWQTDPTVRRAMPITVRVGTPDVLPTPDEWLLGLHPEPDRDDGALGYHDKTPHGQPVLKVFPWLAEDDGIDWTVDAFHEVLEALVDPELDRWLRLQDGRELAWEVCDAVEGDTYDKGGVKLSNFVLPAYFSLAAVAPGTRLDFLGRVQRPGEIRPGGYNQISAGGKLEYVQGDYAGRRFKYERRSWRGVRRKARRRTGATPPAAPG